MCAQSILMRQYSFLLLSAFSFTYNFKRSINIIDINE